MGRLFLNVKNGAICITSGYIANSVKALFKQAFKTLGSNAWVLIWQLMADNGLSA